MRRSMLAIAIAVSGICGSLQASRTVHAGTHKVRRGETAARIARDNGISLSQLEAINPKLNLAKLSVGTILKVKATGPAALHAAQRTTAPMAPLPATPEPGPTSFTHLERILPVQVREAADAAPADGDARPVLADLKPVLPPAGDAAPAEVPAEGFDPADPAHLDLLWPVETRTVSSAWGPRMRSKTVKVKAHRRRVRYQGSHKGVDLTAPTGTTVFAVLDGKVIASGKQKGYGNYVILDHGNGVTTLYGHHKRNFVTAGEIVHRGQKIAEVGRTGNATGPHLHFELRLDGAAQNPLPMLNDVEEIPAEQMAQNRAAVAPKTRR